MKETSSIGARLQQFLDAKKISQVEMAEKLGTSKGVVWQWCNGERFPKVETLAVFAEMGCNLDWLIHGRGAMFINTDAANEALSHVAKLDAIRRIVND